LRFRRRPESLSLFLEDRRAAALMPLNERWAMGGLLSSWFALTTTTISARRERGVSER